MMRTINLKSVTTLITAAFTAVSWFEGDSFPGESNLPSGLKRQTQDPLRLSSDGFRLGRIRLRQLDGYAIHFREFDAQQAALDAHARLALPLALLVSKQFGIDVTDLEAD